MKVNINKKTTDTAATTILELAAELNLPERGMAVAVDNTMVPRTKWAETGINEGADIVIVKAFCGG